MVTMLRRAVVAVLLAVWIFPAAGFARTAGPVAAQSRPAPTETSSPATSAAAPAASSSTPARSYAEREKQSRNLEDFRGGEVGIYIGGGALTVLLLILLIVVLI